MDTPKCQNETVCEVLASAAENRRSAPLMISPLALLEAMQT